MADIIQERKKRNPNFILMFDKGTKKNIKSILKTLKSPAFITISANQSFVEGIEIFIERKIGIHKLQ